MEYEITKMEDLLKIVGKIPRKSSLKTVRLNSVTIRRFEKDWK